MSNDLGRIGMKMPHGYFIPCDNHDIATGEMWEIDGECNEPSVITQTWNFKDAKTVVRALGELVVPEPTKIKSGEQQ
jgi:hypothetical protein